MIVSLSLARARQALAEAYFDVLLLSLCTLVPVRCRSPLLHRLTPLPLCTVLAWLQSAKGSALHITRVQECTEARKTERKSERDQDFAFASVLFIVSLSSSSVAMAKRTMLSGRSA